MRSDDKSFDAGVRAVLAIAHRSADRLRAEPWRPTREGSITALDALAEEAKALLLGQEPPTVDVVPTSPPVLPSRAVIAV